MPVQIEKNRKGEKIANRVLLALPYTTLEPLKRNLEFFDLKLRSVIYLTGAPIEYIYFVNRGLVSLTKTMEDGRTAEVGAVGTEGIVGFFALFGAGRALWDYTVQVPGSAFRIKMSTLLAEMERAPALRVLLQRYTHLPITQLTQTAACNRLHSLAERACRWLLIMQDGAQSDTFLMTHEVLAVMLGVHRAGVSIAASALQRAGLIQYVRGHVLVTDRAGLEKRACECYRAVQTELNQFFRPQIEN